MSTPYVGEIRLLGFSRTPNGWEPCDGRLLPISEYEVLFTLIGTTYGGDGQFTFGLPDLRGRVPLHMGQGPGLSSRQIGESAGIETVTIATSQMPAHTHPMVATTASASAVTPGTGNLPGAVSGDTFYTSEPASSVAVPLSAQAVGNAGGNQPHENTMPTLVLQYCIAWAGIYPSQA